MSEPLIDDDVVKIFSSIEKIIKSAGAAIVAPSIKHITLKMYDLYTIRAETYIQ